MTVTGSDCDLKSYFFVLYINEYATDLALPFYNIV